MKLSVQETMLEGATLADRWVSAQSMGFQGIEVRTDNGHDFANRRHSLAESLESGVVISSVTLDMPVFLGSVEPGDRAEAMTQLRKIVAVAADIGAAGVVIANSCGVASKYLPPYQTPFTDQQAIELLRTALAEIADHAGRAGTNVFLEPLNRFEDYALNRLEQASDIVDSIGNPALGIAFDSYHASLEEASIGAAIRAAGTRIRHVQLGDSNRLEPGRGHYDWPETLTALADSGFDGWFAIECFLSGPAPAVLPAAIATLRRAATNDTELISSAHTSATERSASL